MSFTAFFDTNVLYGVTLNDLWLADAGAFRPLWPADVLTELGKNLLANGFDEIVIERRIATTVKYFPDAMIDGYDDSVNRFDSEKFMSRASRSSFATSICHLTAQQSLACLMNREH